MRVLLLTLMGLLSLLLLGSLLAAAPPKGIEWFQGGVEKALQTAKKHNRPLFLYWGADWCIPCRKLRKTLFPHSSFQKRMKPFISVYLDGDAADSQNWLDKFNGKAYPTLLLLNPAGVELVRLPDNASLEKINQLIDIALAGSKSVEQILKEVKRKPPQKIPEETWIVLAQGEWDAPTWKMLYQKVPSAYSTTKFHFLFQYLSKLPKKQLISERPYAKEFKNFLQDKTALKSLFAPLAVRGPRLVEGLYGAKSTLLVELYANWRREEKLSLQESLVSFYPAFKLYGTKLPKNIRSEFLAHVEKVKKLSPDAPSRQGCLISSIYLLGKINMYGEARKLAQLGIKDIPMMETLSLIEENAGNVSAALKWRRKVWQAGQGGGRFQSGLNYLFAILRLEPRDKRKWPKAAKEVFSDAFTIKGPFWAGRSSAIKRLGRKIRNKKNLAALSKILKEGCGKRKKDKAICLRELAPLL